MHHEPLVQQEISYRVYVNEYKPPHGGTVARHLRCTCGTMEEAKAYAAEDHRIQQHGGEIVRRVVSLDTVYTFGKGEL